MSGVLDIHVLEETVNRVSTLTDAMQRQAVVISETTKRVHAIDGAGTGRDRNLAEYRANVAATLERLSQLSTRAQSVEDAALLPGAEGMQRAEAELIKLQKDPVAAQFYRIVGDAQQARQRGIQQLEARLGSSTAALWAPIDGSLYVDSGNHLPPPDLEALASVRHATYELDAVGASERADAFLGEAVARFVSQSLRPVGEKASSSSLKAFGALVEEVRDWVDASTAEVFGNSSSRTERLSQQAAASAQAELSYVSRAIAAASAPSKTSSVLSKKSDNGGTPLSSSSQAPTRSEPEPDYWAIFALVASARVTRFDPVDFEGYKQEGISRLQQTFSELERRASQGPVGPDASVAPATLHSLALLRGIGTTEVADGIDIVLADVAVRAHLPSPPPVWAARGPEPSPSARANPLQLFVADAIEHFMVNLGSRSKEAFKDRTRRGVFTLVNLTAISQMFASSEGLKTAFGGVGRERMGRLESAAFKDFLADWGQLAPYLMDATVTSAGHQAKLSSKDREMIKDKFRQFNTEFEVLVERHKRYKISDPDLRQRMVREIRALIGPLYYRFYDKHRGGDFSKHTERHIRWDKAQFDAVLSSL